VLLRRLALASEAGAAAVTGRSSVFSECTGAPVELLWEALLALRTYGRESGSWPLEEQPVAAFRVAGEKSPRHE